jgi:hypothetical protein
MTITFELEPEIEKQLEEQAQQRGQTLPEYVMSLVAKGVAESDVDSDSVTHADPVLLSSDRNERNAQIRALVNAPPSLRDAILKASATAAAAIYASEPELTDFTESLMDDDFYGFEEDEAEGSERGS